MVDAVLNKFIELRNHEIVLLSIFGSLFLWRFLYLFLFTGRILFKKKLIVKDTNAIPFSLMLVIRNEESNLRANLPRLLSIENSPLEVVAVDDFSQDNSLIVLGVMRSNSKKLKVSSLNQETRNSAKMAQNIALKAATNEWVIKIPVTISDFNGNWPSNLMTSNIDNINVIYAYSGILPQKGFYNLLYRIENYFQYNRSVAFTCNKMAFVYSEENIAFRKAKYFEIGGFGKNINEPYTNLELVINSFLKKKSTLITFDHSTSIRKSESVKNRDFFELLNKSYRIESHLTIGKKLMLFSDDLTRLTFLPLLAVILVLMPVLWPLFTLLLAIFLIAYSVILKISQNRLKENGIFVPSVIYDLLFPWFKIIYRWYFVQRKYKLLWRNKM